jgi:hypothetical protein
MHSNVGLEIFTAVSMKDIIFWDATPCSLIEVYRGFGGAYSPFLLLLSGYLLGLIFDPEYGGSTVNLLVIRALLNFSISLTNTALHYANILPGTVHFVACV